MKEQELNLDQSIELAKKINSYFITITTREVGEPKDVLNHYVFRNEFPTEDMIPSLDHSVRSMAITHPGETKVLAPVVDIEPLAEK